MPIKWFVLEIKEEVIRNCAKGANLNLFLLRLGIPTCLSLFLICIPVVYNFRSKVTSEKDCSEVKSTRLSEKRLLST